MVAFTIQATQAKATTISPGHGDGRVAAFYDWAQSIPPTAGQLLLKEPLEGELRLPGSAKSYRILYSSSDGIFGKGPVAVSGALFIPGGTPPEGGWPLIAWAHGTVGVADICAPSLQGRSYRDITYLSRWLSEGFAIVGTDYQGLGTTGPHPYLNPRAEAYGVLDSIRAAQSEWKEISREAVIVGHSQGGQAALGAAFFAKDYAPELDIRGVVATGAVDLSTSDDLVSLTENPYSGSYDPSVYISFYLLSAAQSLAPAIRPSEILTEKALRLFDQTTSVCSARLEFDVEGAGLVRTNAFKAGALLGALSPLIGAFAYPSYKTSIPIFLGIGAKDEEVPAAGQLALAKKACAAGTAVEAHLYAGLTHSGSVNGSLKDSLPFARHVLMGAPIASICEPRPE